MPVMTDRRSVAANATEQNVLAGKLAEFLPEPSRVAAYATAAAVGVNISILIGGESLVDDQEISAANRFPLVPDDFVVDGGGLPGDRIIVRLRNTTGAAIIAFTRIEVQPVG